MERYILIKDDNANGAVIYYGPASGCLDALMNEFGGISPEVDSCIEELANMDMANEDISPCESYLGITVESAVYDDSHFWVDE